MGNPTRGVLAKRNLNWEEAHWDKRIERRLGEPSERLDLAPAKQADAARVGNLGRAKVPGRERRSKPERCQVLTGDHALGEKGIKDGLRQTADAGRQGIERREPRLVDQAIYVRERERRSFRNLAGAQHAR